MRGRDWPIRGKKICIPILIEGLVNVIAGLNTSIYCNTSLNIFSKKCFLFSIISIPYH
jgi:hypothetical protein